MKLLAIGDFHGKFSHKLKSNLQKEDFDLVIGVGDYTGLDEWYPLIIEQFKAAKKGIKVTTPVEYFGKKKYNALLKKDYVAGKKVLSEINKLGKPALIIFGNGDWYKTFFNDVGKYYEDEVKKLKNLRQINYGKAKFKDITFIGFGGYMDVAGNYKKKAKTIKEKKSLERRLKRIERTKKKLFNLLKKIKKCSNLFFIFHYPPRGAFDIVKDKKNPFYGISAGVPMFAQAIKKYKPKLVLCGHMHEYQGAKEMHNSLIINPGDAGRGKYAIIDINNNNQRKIKVRFVK